jgi:hypothetical protein
MRRFWIFLMITLCLMLSGGIASAELIFDRGLPTTNLNNAAGADRSNVAWADSETDAQPTEYWLPGDDVVLTGSGIYHIDTVRIWTIASDTSGLSLWAGSDISNGGIFTTYTATQVYYTDGTGYQGSSGNFSSIYQLDFEINEDVAAGTYYFFLDGPWTAYSGGGYVNPFLHASNDALSGSPQEGADDTFQWLHIKNGNIVGVESWLSTGGGTTGWGRGWDKNSDGNIQVFGSAPVPEPSTILLLGFGLVGLAGAARKKMKK